MMTTPLHKVEFARAYRLTMTSIEPVSFSVPRVKAACFQVILLVTMLTTLMVKSILIRTTCSHRRGTCGSQQWQRLSGWLEKTALRYTHFLFPASLSLSSLSCTLSLCSLSCTLLLSHSFFTFKFTSTCRSGWACSQRTWGLCLARPRTWMPYRGEKSPSKKTEQAHHGHFWTWFLFGCFLQICSLLLSVVIS